MGHTVDEDVVLFIKAKELSHAKIAKTNAGFNNNGSSSSSNLAAMGMADNLDMKEMAYTPSVKDMTETRVRHMLTENMFMPKARVSEESSCFPENISDKKKARPKPPSVRDGPTSLVREM